MRNLAQLLKNKRGATAIEYALIASLISVAAIMSFENLGSQIDNRYQAVDQSL
jgi:pilus assembly protein Flp/PilA